MTVFTRLKAMLVSRAVYESMIRMMWSLAVLKELDLEVRAPRLRLFTATVADECYHTCRTSYFLRPRCTSSYPEALSSSRIMRIHELFNEMSAH
jgi:hypothetical protein